ncbi:MAG: FtsW/RodA/SpoVE family cell cycle protein, partial [Actinomycetota bacterium]
VLAGAAAGIWAYALQGLGLHEAVPSDAVAYGIGFVGIAVAGWIGVRITARHADPALYATAIFLGGLGLAMLFRIMDESGDVGIARNQAVWFAIGLGAFLGLLTVLRDIRDLDTYTYTLGLIGMVLLLLPVLPDIGPFGGYETNGARLWFNVGPLIFQPAEFGRLFIVIFLASYLAQKREVLAAGIGRFGLPRAKDLGPLLLAWGASLAVLFLERDMGASLLLFGVFVAMVWVATGRPGYLILGVVLFVVGAGMGYLAFDHVQLRVDAWLHAMDPGMVQDAGFQLAQGWFALATGGMVGTGLGLGSPTLIPYPGSDFILAAFGEELGMLGVSALLLGYLVLIGRGLRIALERRDPFESLLAVGLTALLGLQVFVIAGGVLRLIPLTGVPLPLVAYGGSSRVATFLMLALLVRISAGPWIRARKEG